MAKAHQHVLPLLMVASSAAIKSVKTVSTSSSPARTFIISELGLLYFLGRTEARNAVIVCHVSLVCNKAAQYIHQEHAHLLEHFLP